MPNYFDEDEQGPSGEGAPPPDDSMNEEQPENTFLVNKEAYPDGKPGDTFMVKIVNVMDEDMECMAMPKKEGEEGEEGMEEEPMPEPEMEDSGHPMMQ